MEISSRAHQEVSLITQQGYMMLTKSLTDDLAWAVQREFDVTSYKAIPRGQCDRAIEIVEGCKMPYVIEETVMGLNRQIAI